MRWDWVGVGVQLSCFGIEVGSGLGLVGVKVRTVLDKAQSWVRVKVRVGVYLRRVPHWRCGAAPPAPVPRHAQALPRAVLLGQEGPLQQLQRLREQQWGLHLLSQVGVGALLQDLLWGGGSALCGRPQRWRAGGGPRGAHGGQGLEDEIQQFGAGGGPDVLPVVRLQGGGDNGVVPCSPPTPPGPPYGRVWGLWVGGLRAHRVWGWGGSVPVGVPPPPDVPGG